MELRGYEAGFRNLRQPVRYLYGRAVQVGVDYGRAV